MHSPVGHRPMSQKTAHQIRSRTSSFDDVVCGESASVADDGPGTGRAHPCVSDVHGRDDPQTATAGDATVSATDTGVTGSF